MKNLLIHARAARADARARTLTDALIASLTANRGRPQVDRRGRKYTISEKRGVRYMTFEDGSVYRHVAKPRKGQRRWKRVSPYIRPSRIVPKVEKVCVHCGAAFTPKRSDAKTCGVACRVALHRAG